MIDCPPWPETGAPGASSRTRSRSSRRRTSRTPGSPTRLRTTRPRRIVAPPAGRSDDSSDAPVVAPRRLFSASRNDSARPTISSSCRNGPAHRVRALCAHRAGLRLGFLVGWGATLLRVGSTSAFIVETSRPSSAVSCELRRQPVELCSRGGHHPRSRPLELQRVFHRSPAHFIDRPKTESVDWNCWVCAPNGRLSTGTEQRGRFTLGAATRSAERPFTYGGSSERPPTRRGRGRSRGAL